jgi:hypothetical protein
VRIFFDLWDKPAHPVYNAVIQLRVCDELRTVVTTRDHLIYTDELIQQKKSQVHPRN